MKGEFLTIETACKIAKLERENEKLKKENNNLTKRVEKQQREIYKLKQKLLED